MRVVFFDKYLDYRVGGAQLSSIELFKEFAVPLEFVSCDVRQSFRATEFRDKALFSKKLPIIELPRAPYLEYALNRTRIASFFRTYSQEDILITQELWGGMAARLFPGRTIIFVRSALCANQIDNFHEGYRRVLRAGYLALNRPLINYFLADNRMAFERASAIIANSNSTRNLIKKNTGCSAEVVYPFIDVKGMMTWPQESLSERRFITCIGAEYLKGRPIVEALAKKMPQHHFQIIGRAFSHAVTDRNITYQPWSSDPKQIYHKSRIVIVPSLCREGFGRVAVEAMALGIPVIGSARGGLVEALPADLTVQDPWDLESWEARISQVESRYAELHMALQERALSFDRAMQLERCKEIIQNALSMRLFR